MTHDRRVNHQILSAFSLYSSNQITAAGKSGRAEKAGQEHHYGRFPNFFEKRGSLSSPAEQQQARPGKRITGAEYLEQHVTAIRRCAEASHDKSVFAGTWEPTKKTGLAGECPRRPHSSRACDRSAGYAILTSELRLRVAPDPRSRHNFQRSLFDNAVSSPIRLRPSVRHSKRGPELPVGWNRFSRTYFENRITDLVVSSPIPSVVETVKN